MGRDPVDGRTPRAAAIEYRVTMLALLMAVSLQATSGATCRSVGLEPQRTWQFEKSDETWHVAHWRGAAARDPVRVALPAATTVQLTGEAVSIKARSSNGGVVVALTGVPTQARLDIYVSYELEVNVDTSLTPAIDDLNTEGAIGVRCDVTPAP
jgi:hypothetical protein